MRELGIEAKVIHRKERVDPRAEMTLGYRKWDGGEMGQEPKEKV